MNEPADESEPRRNLWQDKRRSMWAPLVAAIVALALVQAFGVKIYQISSGSMEPTLEIGDRLLVNRLPEAGRSLAPGDIVVFEEPETWGPRPQRSMLRKIVGWVGDIVGFGPSNSRVMVKRVIAEDGQSVECCDDGGALLVDGEPQPLAEDGYDFSFVPGELDCTTEPVSRRCFQEFTVPSRELFVLGDDRVRSADSMKFCRPIPTPGCVVTVPRGDVIGTVITRIWPLSRLGSPADGGTGRENLQDRRDG